jgi:excisionase family DNA binding protein
MTTPEHRRYLTPAQAAKELGMSKSTIYRAISDGSLPAIQLQRHGKLRIPTDALEARSKHRD